MKDNRWLEIDGDLLEEALCSAPKRHFRYRKALIAAAAAIVSLCTLTAVFVPLLEGGEISDGDGRSEASYLGISDIGDNSSYTEYVDIYEIVNRYPDAFEPWDNGEGLTVLTLSGEKTTAGSGAGNSGAAESAENESIDITLSTMPNVKLESYTAGRYIDMTGNGEGRYDEYQEARGIYLDIITGEFFCLEDEIKIAAIGDRYEDVYGEFLLVCAMTFGLCEFSGNPTENDMIFEKLMDGEITYKEALARFDGVPKNFGFTDKQESDMRRYFEGEEINVGRYVFPDDIEMQRDFCHYAKGFYHWILKKHGGEVTILEFGSDESKCLYIREYDYDGHMFSAASQELGIFDRAAKELRIVPIQNVYEILWFGTQYTTNSDYGMFSYISTRDGGLCLVDTYSGISFSGYYNREDDIIPAVPDKDTPDSEESITEESADGESSADESAADESAAVAYDLRHDITDDEASGEATSPGTAVGAVGKPYFSTDGGYVYCKLTGSIERWLFLSTQDGSDTVIEGRFIKFVAGGSAVIMQTEDGARIYDVATKVDITDMLGEELNLVDHEMHTFFENGEGGIVWKNLINGDETVIADEYDAYIIDKNAGCIYIFTKSDRTLRGYGAADGLCGYEARIGRSFVDGAPADAIFDLLLDSDEKTLLVSYYTPLSLEFDESKFWEMHGNNWNISGDIGSIPSWAYIYLRCVKYNGKYLNCYDSDDVNGEVDNIEHLGKYLLFEDMLEMASDDMIIDRDELAELGHLFAEKTEHCIEIDSMGRVKAIPEYITEYFGYELNIGETFTWDIYLPAIRPLSSESGKEYIANFVGVNVDTLSGGIESDETKAFKADITEMLETRYKHMLEHYPDGYSAYRMSYETKIQMRDTIRTEYEKRFS